MFIYKKKRVLQNVGRNINKIYIFFISDKDLYKYDFCLLIFIFFLFSLFGGNFLSDEATLRSQLRTLKHYTTVRFEWFHEIITLQSSIKRLGWNNGVLPDFIELGDNVVDGS